MRCYSTLFFLLLFAVAGCGEGIQRVAVEGNVSFDGKPIQKGSIFFRPAGNTKGVSAGGEIIDGRYKLPASKGPVAGINIVEFYADFKTGRKVPKEPGNPSAGLTDEVLQLFPAHLNTQSKVQCKIKANQNTYDFNLSSK